MDKADIFYFFCNQIVTFISCNRYDLFLYACFVLFTRFSYYYRSQTQHDNPADVIEPFHSRTFLFKEYMTQEKIVFSLYIHDAFIIYAASIHFQFNDVEWSWTQLTKLSSHMIITHFDFLHERGQNTLNGRKYQVHINRSFKWNRQCWILLCTTFGSQNPISESDFSWILVRPILWTY